jgi:PAT family beta-lactamase induction signal transducer AmpG
VAAYRVGMVASTAGALFLVTGFEYAGLSRLDAWMASFAAMAALVLIGIVTVLCAREPEQSRIADAAAGGKPSVGRIAEAAMGAFSEFLTQRHAIVVLVFVMLFKFTDAFAGAMTVPFIIDVGFTRNDYAIIVKGVGLAATLIGGFAGGFLARGCSLVTCLWIGAVLQAVSNLTFTWLALVGPQQWALTVAVSVEAFTGAIGTVIFVAYLSALCKNPLHTATQYALLTALASVGRIYLSSGAGYVAAATGWPLFFVVSTVVAVPSLILLAWLQRRGHFDGLGTARA